MSRIGNALGCSYTKTDEYTGTTGTPRPATSSRPSEPEFQHIEVPAADVKLPVGDVEKERIRKNTERPAWYGSESGQDVIDVAEDFGIVDNAYKFNMLKYLLRGGKKAGNSELQDMTKIRVYLDRYIEKLKKGE